MERELLRNVDVLSPYQTIRELDAYEKIRIFIVNFSSLVVVGGLSMLGFFVHNLILRKRLEHDEKVRNTLLKSTYNVINTIFILMFIYTFISMILTLQGLRILNYSAFAYPLLIGIAMTSIFSKISSEKVRHTVKFSLLTISILIASLSFYPYQPFIPQRLVTPINASFYVTDLRNVLTDYQRYIAIFINDLCGRSEILATPFILHVLYGYVESSRQELIHPIINPAYLYMTISNATRPVLVPFPLLNRDKVIYRWALAYLELSLALNSECADIIYSNGGSYLYFLPQKCSI
jgi:hypothetical protein